MVLSSSPRALISFSITNAGKHVNGKILCLNTSFWKIESFNLLLGSTWREKKEEQLRRSVDCSTASIHTYIYIHTYKYRDLVISYIIFLSFSAVRLLDDHHFVLFFFFSVLFVIFSLSPYSVLHFFFSLSLSFLRVYLSCVCVFLTSNVLFSVCWICHV